MSRFSRWWKAAKPRWWRGDPPVAPTVTAETKQAMKLTRAGLAAIRAERRGLTADAAGTFNVYQPAPGVLPTGTEASSLAMDYDLPAAQSYAISSGWAHEGLRFPGFPYLAELAQRPEYRMLSETYAKELTRRWIRTFGTSDDDDKTVRIKQLDAELKRLKLRDRFREMAEMDGFFGRGHLFADFGQEDDDPELTKPLILDPRKVKKGSLRGFNAVEPMWTYPAAYNASKPLQADFFKPRAWYVMGNQVHPSRLRTFISRKVPNILLPSYAFAGLSMSQMAKPYVDNWLRTRQSVSDLLHAFSVMVLATNMQGAFDGGGMEQAALRAEVFSLFRDNKGLFEIDKDTEELTNVAAPLGGLHELQAQSQEQQASISGIPLVKLLGNTPSGLNASSDGEIRVFYDRCNALQEHLFSENLDFAIKLAQLNIWGEIDPEIGWEFVPLWQMDEAAEASIRKTDADRDVEYVDAGVVSPEEVRQRLAKDPKSGYHGLKAEDLPEPPEEEQAPSILPNAAKTAEPKRVEMSVE